MIKTLLLDIETAPLLKRCSSCKASKDIGEFHKSANRRLGRHAYCKECVRTKNAMWVRSNKEKHAATCANWYAKNKSTAAAKSSEWHYQFHYGISKSEFLSMVDSVNGKCQCCGITIVVGTRANNGAVLDHDHATGKIRGVLCSGCNKGIGLLKDSAVVLEMAAAYLKSRNAAPPDYS